MSNEIEDVEMRRVEQETEGFSVHDAATANWLIRKVIECRRYRERVEMWAAAETKRAEREDRIVLHYLPAYSPQDNPIERVWWHLHEQITRNHQCQSIEELVKLTMVWLEERRAFKIEGAMYDRLRAAA